MNAPIKSPRDAQKPFRSSHVTALLPRVEKLMQSLARGKRVDRAGAMASEQLATGGKRIRARLALEACSCFGVDEDSAVHWAAAMELLHNATLIHDDIQDGDTTRRGQPTIWATHGVAQAINAGDLMLMLPYLAVAQIKSDEQAVLHGLVAAVATDIVRGQVEELGLREAERLDLESYISAARGKTGALLALPVVGAAILGGRSLAQAEALGEYFTRLGVLFQIQDDVVDVYGDKGRYRIGCDIYEGKVSALLVAHLEAAPNTREFVLGVIDRPREETTEHDVGKVRDLYVLSGALDDVVDLIVEIRDDVLKAPLLRGESRLYDLAASLVQMALAPLAKCMTPAQEECAS